MLEKKKMNDENPFESNVRKILENFKLNVIKAAIISELKKEHVESTFGESLKKEIENIQKQYGIENIAKNQTIVMLVTSFEAFIKDFFRIMITREDLLKNALRKCEYLKIKPKDMIGLLNNKILWGDLIIDNEKISFQNFKSLCKAFDMIQLSFEDIVEDAIKEVDTYLKEESKGTVRISILGSEWIKGLFSDRHKIVHEGMNLEIDDLSIRNAFLFLEILVSIISNKFFKIETILVVKPFTYEKIK